MATVKIILDANETEEEAREMLLKSLTHHDQGAEHRQDFRQPAARDVIAKMNSLHQDMWTRMLKEISEVIEKEV